MRQQVPDWVPENFFNSIKEELEGDADKCEIDWVISKPAMIATLNYIRNKGYKCEWVQKREDQFLITITKPNPTTNA